MSNLKYFIFKKNWHPRTKRHTRTNKVQTLRVKFLNREGEEEREREKEIEKERERERKRERERERK